MSKIMIVDDEFDNLAALKAGLEAEGYGVTTAQDPRKALKEVEGDAPDLVITDLMMPYLSGYELILGLRDTKACERTPIILMSSITPSAKQAHFRWNVFLPKPIHFDALLAAVKTLIGEPKPVAR